MSLLHKKMLIPFTRCFFFSHNFKRGPGVAESSSEADNRMTSSMMRDNEMYEMSLHWLNKMFDGVLSMKQRKNLIKYLVPSGLFAKDARPHLDRKLALRPDKIIHIKNGVPLCPAYYMKAPKFQDHLYQALRLNSLPQKNSSCSKESDEVKSWSFVSHKRLCKNLGEDIPISDYTSFIRILSCLRDRQDNSTLAGFLKIYRRNTGPTNSNRSVTPTTSVSTEKTQNENKVMTSRNMGYRKTSTADVTLVAGVGEISVNGRPFENYFPFPLNRETVMAPFYEIGNTNFDVEVNVIGGGLSGQAGAARMAIANGLASLNPGWRDILDKAGYLTKDERVVERKKYGRHKARKRYTWVAR